MVTPDPRHEASRDAFVQFDAAEQLRRISIPSYQSVDYVPSEVLLSLVRAQFGEKSGILGAAVNVLYARVQTLVRRFLYKNAEWTPVLASTSEAVSDVTSEVWMALLKDEGSITFGEVRFFPCVVARAQDYLRKQLNELKHGDVSLESLTATDIDGNEIGHLDLKEGDSQDAPEEVVDRLRRAQRLQDLLLAMPKPIRDAVHLRLEFDYTWDQIAEMIGVTSPTAQRYFRLGCETLKKEP